MMIQFKTGLAAVALAASLALSFPATAQNNELRSLVERLNRMEGTLNDLQRQFYRGEAPAAPASPAASPDSISAAPLPPVGQGAAPRSTSSLPVSPETAAALQGPAAIHLGQRIDELEAALRTVTGNVEEASFDVRQMKQRLEKLIEDVDFRLTAIERNMAAPAPGGGSAAAAGAPPSAEGSARVVDETLPAGSNVLGTLPADQAPAQPAAAPSTDGKKAVLPEGSAEDRYRFALGLLRQGDFAEAEAAFAEFLEAHPDSRLAGNAQYWLGESYYVRKDYTHAASAFLAGYQNYPENPKAADNLLKLGMTLTNMGQTEEACASLARLTSQFPNISGPQRQAAERARKQAGCQ